MSDEDDPVRSPGGVMGDPSEITTYEVAREVLNRQVGNLLCERDAATNPQERQRLEAERGEVVRRRTELEVGSEEAARIVEQAHDGLAVMGDPDEVTPVEDVLAELREVRQAVARRRERPTR